MPRVVSLVNTQSVRNNPTTSISKGAMANLPAILAQVPDLVTPQSIENLINDLLTQIDDATGLDLLPLAKTLESWFSTNDNLLTTLMDWLFGINNSSTSALQGVSWLTSLTNDVIALFNGSGLTTALLSLIPAPTVANVTQNLQQSWDFPNAGSIVTTAQWSWSGAVDHTGTAGSGSAQCVCDGVLQGLRGTVGAVQPGQTITVTAYVKWSGVSATSGTHPFQLQLVPYSGSGSSLTAGTPTTPSGCEITSPGASSTTYSGESAGWVELTGTYTVPSSGVTALQLRLLVTADATAGTVYWDDCTAYMSGGWLADLDDDVTDIIDSFAPGGTSGEFQTGVTNLLALFGLTPSDVGGATVIDTVWTTVINDIINPINAIVTQADTWWSQMLTELGISGGSSGTNTGSAITAASAAATTAGTNASIAISSASAANTLAQGTIDGLNTAWSAGGTGNPVTTIPTIASAIPTSAVVGGAAAAAAWGASGTGSSVFPNGTPETTTETHTIAAGDLGVLATVSYMGGAASSSTFSSAVTYGGAAMTLLYSTKSGINSGGSAAYLEVWWLKSPPSGSQTVSVTVTCTAGSGNILALGIKTTSYSASKIVATTPFSGSGGTTMSMTTSSATGHVVLAAFAEVTNSGGFTITTSGLTSRYNSIGTGVGNGWGMAFGDEPGASSLTFGGTSSATIVSWVGLTVEMSN